MFKVGDEVRIKVTEEEWADYFKEKPLANKDLILEVAKSLAEKYKAPLIIKSFIPSKLTILELAEVISAENIRIKLPKNYLMPFKLETLYTTTEEGFSINEKDWEKGLTLL